MKFLADTDFEITEHVRQQLLVHVHILLKRGDAPFWYLCHILVDRKIKICVTLLRSIVGSEKLQYTFYQELKRNTRNK